MNASAAKGVSAVPATTAELTDLHPDLLDCYEDNLEVLLGVCGVRDTLHPFARDWAFVPGRHGVPALGTSRVEDRIRQDTPWKVHRHAPGDPLRTTLRLLRQSRHLMLVGDAYDMPWLPYFKRVHMDHSFLITTAPITLNPPH